MQDYFESIGIHIQGWILLFKEQEATGSLLILGE